jgi:hypothetical protein
MGCFDKNCAISGLPITSSAHTPCYVLLIHKVGLYSDRSGPFSHYRPIGIPLKGVYDDCGQVKLDATPARDWLESYFNAPAALLLECVTQHRRRFGPRYGTDSELMQAIGYTASKFSPATFQGMGFTLNASNDVSHPLLDERKDKLCSIEYNPEGEEEGTSTVTVETACGETRTLNNMQDFCDFIYRLLFPDGNNRVYLEHVFGLKETATIEQARILQFADVIYIHADIYEGYIKECKASSYDEARDHWVNEQETLLKLWADYTSLTKQLKRESANRKEGEKLGEDHFDRMVEANEIQSTIRNHEYFRDQFSFRDITMPHFPKGDPEAMPALHDFYWFCQSLHVLSKRIYPTSMSHQHDSAKDLLPYFKLNKSLLKTLAKEEKWARS